MGVRNMGLQVLVSFLLYDIISAITPGPGNILALNTIVNYGWKKSRKLFLGIFTGYYLTQIICAFLIFGLDRFLNPIMTVMKYVGAAYILWLTIHIVLSKPDFKATEKNPSFFIGFILQLVNVKIYFFGMTALSGYIIPYYNSLSALIMFELIIATIGTTATLTWAFMGNLFERVYRKHYRLINIILGLFLLACVISLLLQKT
jgi:cysteine/O-acetylserine efflux protein